MRGLGDKQLKVEVDEGEEEECDISSPTLSLAYRKAKATNIAKGGLPSCSLSGNKGPDQGQLPGPCPKTVTN